MYNTDRKWRIELDVASYLYEKLKWKKKKKNSAAQLERERGACKVSIHAGRLRVIAEKIEWGNVFIS